MPSRGLSEETLAWAAARITERTRGLVLDIGCGDGRFLPPGAVGLDLDTQRLLLARRRSPLVVRADAHALPFRRGAFATVYAHRMLNDAGRVDEVLAEIRRVLAPAGRLLVLTGARAAESGDRLDRGNGVERLSRHFGSVTVEVPPADDRAALFIADSPP